MRRRAALIAALTSTAVLGLAAPAHAAVAVLDAPLTGAAEVPGPGDPDGSGQAKVVAIPSQDRICYVVRVRGIATPTAAHIHEAPAGEAGPVVVTLATPAAGASGGCIQTDEADDIAENPEDYYVNVHNTPYPAGALRGQLG